MNFIIQTRCIFDTIVLIINTIIPIDVNNFLLAFELIFVEDALVSQKQARVHGMLKFLVFLEPPKSQSK